MCLGPCLAAEKVKLKALCPNLDPLGQVFSFQWVASSPSSKRQLCWASWCGCSSEHGCCIRVPKRWGSRVSGKRCVRQQQKQNNTSTIEAVCSKWRGIEQTPCRQGYCLGRGPPQHTSCSFAEKDREKATLSLHHSRSKQQLRTLCIELFLEWLSC